MHFICKKLQTAEFSESSRVVCFISLVHFELPILLQRAWCPEIYKQNPHRLADLCAVRISFQLSLNAHDMAENTLISQFKSRKFARAQRRHNVLLIRRISVYMYGVAWDSINVDWCFERAMRKRERMRRAPATWHSEDLQKTSIFFQEIIPSTTFRHQTTSWSLSSLRVCS